MNTAYNQNRLVWFLLEPDDLPPGTLFWAASTLPSDKFVSELSVESADGVDVLPRNRVDTFLEMNRKTVKD